MYFPLFLGSKIDSRVEKYFGRSEDGFYFCKAPGCDYLSQSKKSKFNLQRHVETRHYTPGYPCSRCPKVYKAQTDLKKHLYLSKSCGRAYLE